jgi:hypothetical protein
VDWIQVVQERDIAYAVMNLGVPWRRGVSGPTEQRQISLHTSVAFMFFIRNISVFVRR